MESIKKQIDAFLDSASGQDQEKLKELLITDIVMTGVFNTVKKF